MRLRLAISPCPNDTFMFDALVNGRIDTGRLRFDVEYHDIEQLNLRAKSLTADFTKISYAALPEVNTLYAISDSGSALGRGNGPLVVARSGEEKRIGEMIMAGRGGDLKVAVPGFNTTANLLMKRLFPSVTGKSELLFSEIAEGVASGKFDAGVLIHEGRFTFRDKGLALVCDLGAQWELHTGLPLPLGGIAVSRRLPREAAEQFQKLLRQGIRFAFENPEVSREYVKSHAREMDDKVIDNHISLFVNDYSLSLGTTGRKAVTELTGLDSAVFL